MPLKYQFATRPIDADRQCTMHEDALAMQASSEFAKLDAGLFQSKWFDYRFVTPFRATMLYATAFQKVTTVMYARERDKTSAEFYLTCSPERLLPAFFSTEHKKSAAARVNMSGLWRGRQVADAIGCPYDFYIEWAMTFRLRHWKNKHLPKPTHLYHEWDVEKVVKRWDEEQASRMFLAEHPAYMVENFEGLQVQVDYHDWLIKQASLRNDRLYVLSEFVKEGRLTRERADSVVEPHEKERFADLLQSPYAISL